MSNTKPPSGRKTLIESGAREISSTESVSAICSCWVCIVWANVRREQQVQSPRLEEDYAWKENNPVGSRFLWTTKRRKEDAAPRQSKTFAGGRDSGGNRDLSASTAGTASAFQAPNPFHDLQRLWRLKQKIAWPYNLNYLSSVVPRVAVTVFSIAGGFPAGLISDNFAATLEVMPVRDLGIQNFKTMHMSSKRPLSAILQVLTYHWRLGPCPHESWRLGLSVALKQRNWKCMYLFHMRRISVGSSHEPLRLSLRPSAKKITAKYQAEHLMWSDFKGLQSP
ncbi:hypothetical protein C8R43DRAFT_160575 [Mycena crocata]|nr:hypothetical protein C8R43DRAFT_160575 [Mycena crocata]